jgi:hypothetical protein
MASIAEWRARRARSHTPRGSRRRWILLLVAMLTLLVAAGGAILLGRQATSAGSATSVAPPIPPADRFVQSIVTHNGKLGWTQLCPNIQAVLPEDQLTQQADAARAAAAQQGLQLTWLFVRAQPMQAGGETRLYVITAHWPNGAIQQRGFAVAIQRSGCVEDAAYQ